jgi:hypothetical protein
MAVAYTIICSTLLEELTPFCVLAGSSRCSPRSRFGFLSGCEIQHCHLFFHNLGERGGAGAVTVLVLRIRAPC